MNVTVVTLGIAGSASYAYTDKPGTPAAPTATAGITSATVTWTAPASNNSAITGYIVTPYLNGVAQTPVSYGSTATTQTLTGLTAGGSYTFTVAAVNAIGTGSASPQSAAVVPYALPGAPTIGSVSAGDSAATVNWTAPASNGGSAITRVRRHALHRGGGPGRADVREHRDHRDGDRADAGHELHVQGRGGQRGGHRAGLSGVGGGDGQHGPEPDVRARRRPARSASPTATS